MDVGALSFQYFCVDVFFPLSEAAFPRFLSGQDSRLAEHHDAMVQRSSQKLEAQI